METPKRNPRILWAIVLLLCLSFAISYGARLAAQTKLEAMIQQQTERIAAAKQRQQTLQQQLTYVRSDAYVEEVARNELGMVQEGDEVLIMVKGANSSVAPHPMVDATTTDHSPFWQAWLTALGF